MKFLTCVPLWAILIAQCGQSWLFYTQLTELPTYMNNILHFDIVSVSTDLIADSDFLLTYLTDCTDCLYNQKFAFVCPASNSLFLRAVGGTFFEDTRRPRIGLCGI